jgi:hypothetical protein
MPHNVSPPQQTPLRLKQLQEVSLFYFVYVYEAHQSFSLTFISSIPSLPPTKNPLKHCTYFKVYLSLLIPKSMFKEISQNISAVSIVYFGIFNPFYYILK